MTWTEMLTIETRRLHAQEGLAVAVFETLRAQATGEAVRSLLRGLIDQAPSRLGRLEVALAYLGEEEGEEGRPLRSFEGWQRDVDELGAGPSRGEAHDAATLGLLLRAARSRTACYEVAALVARGMRTDPVANLLEGILQTDRESDARIGLALERVVVQGEGRWELGEMPC